MEKITRKITGVLFLFFLPCLMTIVSLHIANLYSSNNIKELSAEVMDVEVIQAPYSRVNPGSIRLKYKYTFDNKQYIISKEETPRKVIKLPLAKKSKDNHGL